MVLFDDVVELLALSHVDEHGVTPSSVVVLDTSLVRPAFVDVDMRRHAVVLRRFLEKAAGCMAITVSRK